MAVALLVRRVVLAAVLALVAGGAAAAQADTFVIGSQTLPAGGSVQICGGTPCTVLQGQVAPASAGTYAVRSPVDGTIVSWSYRNGNGMPGDAYALRVLRPSNPQQTQFKAVGTGESPIIPDMTDAIRGSFPVSIAVKAGDRIGLESRGPGNFGVPILTTGQNDPATGDGVRYFQPPLADGGAGTAPLNPGNTGQQVLVQATVVTGPPPPFVPPPPPPPPDFNIAFSQPRGKLPFSMARNGGPVDVPLTVHRLNGSRGPIALRVTGVPAGLKATLSSPTVDSVYDTPIFVRIERRSAAAHARPGSYRLRVIGTPSSPATGPAAHTRIVNLNVLGAVAVNVEGIEVNQSVQYFEQPYGGAYYGVPLMDGKKTIARVFADFEGVTGKIRGKARLPDFGMALYGYDAHGHQLPLSPLLPKWSPPGTRLAVNDQGLTASERTGPNAFTFELPASWTIRGRQTRLTAVALGSDINLSAAALCVQTSCGASPTTTLPGISYQRAPAPKRINALSVLSYDPKTFKFGSSFPDISQFAAFQAMSPVPIQFMVSNTYRTSIPSFRALIVAPSNQIWETTRDWDDAMGHPGDYTVGDFELPNGGGGGIAPGPRTAVGSDDPNRVVVSHETMHLFGFRHADSSCGGGGGGFPEPTGRLASVGLDTVEGSGGGGPGSPPYAVIGDTPASPGFDLMSYCAGYDNSWISALNWGRMIDPSAPRARGAERLRTVARAGASNLDVQARIDNGTGQILSVGPAIGPVPAPTPGSSYVLVARNAAGGVVASTPMALEVSHVDGSTVAATLLDGAVPAAGVARVEVLSSTGALVAARDRTANAPQVAIRVPGSRARVGGKRPVTVRWRSSDADGGQRTASLDYSSNGGRSFAHVFTGPDTGSARLPASMLAASNNARLRVRVNDGFNEGEATSARFTVLGRAPQVTIVEPANRERIVAGAIVNLAGGAVDDHGRPIAGRRLRWFAGGRLLGRGEKLTRTLAAGTRVVRLVAVDRSGRTAVRAVKVVVPATRPYFLELKAPVRLSRRARTLVLTVAATHPGTVSIGRRRFSVGRRARRIRVGIAAGRTSLRLTATLTAGGGRNRQHVVVARR